MFSTLFGCPAARSLKRAQRRSAGRHYRTLRLECLETRQLLTGTALAGLATTGPPPSTAASVASVTPVAVSSFSVTGLPVSCPVGTPETITVTALDALGNTLTSYTGTVEFTSDDPSAALPANYTFKSSDAGTHTFSVTFYSPGTSRSVTVFDTASMVSGKEAAAISPSTALRYSTTSNTIYVESGTMTLTQIHTLLPTAPLTLVDPVNMVWALDAKIVVQNGATLQLHGTSVGGDVNELRMESNNAASGKVFVFIEANYGTIDIDAVAGIGKTPGITSWDNSAKVPGPDTNFEDGRAYIRASSTLAADGVTPQESTMNIVNSNIGYLGYYTEEAYGLSWKVEGTPQPTNVHVYGNIEGDTIYDNFFGVYTYGLQGDYGTYATSNPTSGAFTNNNVYGNVDYGFDLHNSSDGILIQGNNVHNNGLSATQYHIGYTYYENPSQGPKNLPDGGYTQADALNAHGIILSIDCNGNVISNNSSTDNLGHGIMLHDASDQNVVSGNTSQGNLQAGVAVLDSQSNTIDGNTIDGNKLDGLRFTVASANNTAENNTIYGNGFYGIDLFPGDNTPLEGGNGHPDNNTVSGNTLYNNAKGGINVLEGDNNTIEGNTIYGNKGAAEVFITSAVDNVFSGNSFINPAITAADANAILASTGSATIKSDTIINSQPALVVNLDANSTLTFNTPQFSLAVASAKVKLNLQVTGLTAGQKYSVTRNGTAIGTFTANSSGVILFSDLPGSTAVVQYQVQ